MIWVDTIRWVIAAVLAVAAMGEFTDLSKAAKNERGKLRDINVTVASSGMAITYALIAILVAP